MPNARSHPLLTVRYLCQLRKRRAVFTMNNIVTVIGELGHGSFSKVMLAEDQSGKKLCVKVIPKDRMSREKDLEHLTREICVLSSLRHPNIVRYYGSSEDEHNYSIYMEYCQGTSLLNFISRYKRLCDATARHIARRLLSVIDFLHRHHIYHRDIKPENIIILPNNDVKVVDFGLCAMTENEYLSTFCGTLSYTAPEILEHKCYSGAAVDVWSAGVVIYAMLQGDLPWSGTNALGLLTNMRQKPLMMNMCSDECQKLLSAMLSRDPALRPSAYEALHSEWLSNHDDDILPVDNIVEPRICHFAIPAGLKYKKRTFKRNYESQHQIKLEQTRDTRKAASQKIRPYASRLRMRLNTFPV